MTRRRLTSVPPLNGAVAFDPWHFDDGTGYSKDKFYMSSKDMDGHYEKLQVKMPGDVADRVLGFAADDQFPYDTQHDFVRDACVHRLHDLAEMGYIKDPELVGWVKLQIMKGALATQEAVSYGFNDMLVRIRTRLQNTRTEQDEDGFGEVMQLAKEAWGDQREPYAGKLAALIREFGGEV